jgi:dTDP-4-dehydrorhamnose reductase
VYEGSANIPLKEGNKTGPVNIYGRSKLKGEEIALEKDPDTIILRTSWVYSSFGNNFVKTMLHLFKEKSEINVVADQYGSPTYAADLASTIMEFIEKTQQGKQFSGIFNYCNEGIISWYQFAEEIKMLINSSCIINPIPTSSYKTAAERPRYSVLDTSKINQALQISIPDWKESLEKCMGILNAV